jgi:hypothetical protein
MLTQEQKERVRYLIEDGWVDPDDNESSTKRNLKAALAQVSSSLELHYFSSHHNWDGGIHSLEMVVSHPLCDAGTALMIFWLGQPGYFFGKEALEIYEVPQFRLLKDIQQRYIKGKFASHDIFVDPASVLGMNLLQENSFESGFTQIESKLKSPSPGQEAPPLSLAP